MGSLLALLLLGPGAVAPEGTPLTWWSYAVVAPDGARVEGLAIGAVDESWAAAQLLTPDLFPVASRETSPYLSEHHGALRVTADLDRDGRAEKAVVGIYRDKVGGAGRFLLILKDTPKGWRKKAVFTQPGEPGLSLLFLEGEELVWATCVACDTWCSVSAKGRTWKLECDSCCDD